MQDESKVEMALVVKKQHDAQKMEYRYSTHEIPAHKAEEQLSWPDEKRNHYFKGARYATQEEIDIYNKEQKRTVVKSKKSADPEDEELIVKTKESVKEPKTKIK
jgi:hypothetical protein